MGKHFTGIRGLMNHVASWSGREIDYSAFLNEPEVKSTFEQECNLLEQSLTEARQQVDSEALGRLRLKSLRPGIDAVESGGITARSWCEFVFVLAEELHPAFVALVAHGKRFNAERFAERIIRVDWSLVSRELPDDLEWLETIGVTASELLNKNEAKPIIRHTDAAVAASTRNGSNETLGNRGELPRAIVDVLKNQQFKVVDFLWRQSNSVRIDRLREECWRTDVELERVRTTVRRVVKTLFENDITNISIEFSETKAAVRLMVE